jgi:drug/metabolite transporter (DMT)-like permease
MFLSPRSVVSDGEGGRTLVLPLPVVVAAFCILWSLAFVAGKIGVAYCPPLFLLAARFLAAGILILAVARLRGQSFALSRREIAVFAVLGLVNNALYLGLGYVALTSVSAGLGGLIISTNPVLTSLLAALLLGEALTFRKVAGLVLGIAGVALIVAHRLSTGSDGLQGILLSITSLIALVVGTILFKRLAPTGNLWIGNGIQNLAAGLVLLPLALGLSRAGDIVPNLRLLAAFAFLVLGGSMLAFFLWFHLVRVCGAAAASAYHFLMPPLAMFFAWAVLGEHVVAFDFLGILPVVLGIYLVTRPADSARRAAISAIGGR